MKKTKEQKGITLISLVITIILLLILATVAINLAVDSDGLFRKAGQAANSWNESVVQEDTELGNLMTMLDEMDKPTLGKVFNEDMIGQSVTYSANGQNEWIILGEDPQKAGNILITTKAPVADGFNLYGSAEKWLSYETDLHTACAVYGGSIGGIEVEARSITMDDINRVTGFEKIKSELEFETYIFGTKQDFTNKEVNYLYPKAGSTWTDEGEKVWSSWKQPAVDNEATFDCDVYLYDASQYVYMQGGLQQTVTTTEHINAEKANLIWGTENDLSYVVASKSSAVLSDQAMFLGAAVNRGQVNVGLSNLCDSNSESVFEAGATGSVPVRPVVSLPSNIPVKEVDGMYDIGKVTIVSEYITETSEVAGVEKERTAPIPAGYVASKATGENTIAGGLVIYQTSTEINDENHDDAVKEYNQYVWIPVDDINDMVMCKKNAEGSICNLIQEQNGDLKCTTHNSNDLAGRLYTVAFEDMVMTPITDADGNQTGIIAGSNMDFTQNTQKYEDLSGQNDFYEPITNDTLATQMQSDFNNMAKSVAKYGGFYISRYEVGEGGTSFKGQIVSEQVNWYTLQSRLRKTGAATTSQMIWGSQYDQVIKFIGEEAEVGHSDRNLGDEPALSGNNPDDEMKNIYDLEGNYGEWTAEEDINYKRTVRGGGFDYIALGQYLPASFRLTAHADVDDPLVHGCGIVAIYFTSRTALYVNF